MQMYEVGGYLEIENYNLPMLHDTAIGLNCGRNALAWLIRARNIKKILLPKLLCNSVLNVCRREGIEIRYYDIDSLFLPANIFQEEGEWLYLVNYYGQLSQQQISEFVMRFRNVILDNTQAYFQMPLKGVDTLYSCRKFFGVPDGAFLYTDAVWNEQLPCDESWQRMDAILGRYERTAQEFYDRYIAIEKLFEDTAIKRMSKLTANLLRGIDYKQVKNIRTSNYLRLHSLLGTLNQLDLQEVEGAYMYPLYIENGMTIRRRLCEKKLYIPTLWKEVIEKYEGNNLE